MAAAIFDMDGLLIDSERATLAAWLHGARQAGVPLAKADYLQVVGRAAPESDAILRELLGGPQAFDAARAAARAVLNHAEAVFPIRPGAAELLAALRAARVPCAVASSSTHAEIRHRLGAIGVLAHFDAIAGGDEVARGKPTRRCTGWPRSAWASTPAAASRSRTARTAPAPRSPPARTWSWCPT